MPIIYLLSRLRLLSCSLVAFKSLAFLFFCSFSQSSFAADYYWTTTFGGPQYPTAESACKAKVGATFHHISFPNGAGSTPAFCYWKRASDGAVMQGGGADRSGDSCPAGKIYINSIGGCGDPPPVCKAGDLFPSKGTVGTVITTQDGRNFVASVPVTMCKAQCEFSDPSARPTSCYGTAGDTGWCNFVIKSTGNNCSADSYTIAISGPALNPADTPNVPPSDADNPLCPTGWAVSAGTCYKLPVKPCDPSTGAVCAPGTTDPNATPPSPGAGGTAGTPSEGTGGRDESSDGADADLEDLESNNTDAEPCKPKADGSGCGGSTVKGEQCDKDIVCTGDAVQCAILRQSKKQACDSDYKDARPFIEQQIAKDAYKLTSNEVNGGSLFSAGLNAPRWLPASCPAPKPISIKGVSTSLSFEPACQFASSLGPLFVALAGVFFAVYVGRAFGGS